MHVGRLCNAWSTRRGKIIISFSAVVFSANPRFVRFLSQERRTGRRWSRGSPTSGSSSSATDGCNKNTPDRPAACDLGSCTNTESGAKTTIMETGAQSSAGPGTIISGITCARTTVTWYACPAGREVTAAKVRNMASSSKRPKTNVWGWGYLFHPFRKPNELGAGQRNDGLVVYRPRFVVGAFSVRRHAIHTRKIHWYRGGGVHFKMFKNKNKNYF